MARINLNIVKTLIAAVAAVTTSAQACTFGMHLGTYHMGHSYITHTDRIYDGAGNLLSETFVKERRDLRAFNPGAWVNCDGPTFGAFSNSIGRASAYAGVTLSEGRAALTVGAVTGYGKPRLMLVPSIRVAWGLRIAAFPTRGPSAGGIHFMWELEQ